MEQKGVQNKSSGKCDCLHESCVRSSQQHASWEKKEAHRATAPGRAGGKISFLQGAVSIVTHDPVGSPKPRYIWAALTGLSGLKKKKKP